MALTVFNSLTRQKEPFVPLSESESSSGEKSTPDRQTDRGDVKMYVCGVTVYDYCHLGHARTYVSWDVVRRYLTWKGYSVTYVQNFTDVDDKILKRARERGSNMQAISEEFIDAYMEDMERLNVLPADAYPKATQSLSAIYQLIQDLELKQFAYQVPGQARSKDVYYEVRKFDGYGKLSGRKLEDMQAGASGRVDAETTQKRDPFDFALWKSADRSEEGFESPWGWGRPGWHIECSAMVRENLGDRIDIHAGGADLKFPHHENEIAQSEPLGGEPFAKYWMHNGFLNIDGEKMSKSLGNFKTIRDVLDHYEPMALRLFFLQTQYRSPIDLTDESLTAASSAWKTLSTALTFTQTLNLEDVEPETEAITAAETSLDDDFNSPGALAVAFDLAKTLTKENNQLKHTGAGTLDAATLAAKAQALVAIADILGLAVSETTGDEESLIPDALTDAAIQELLDRRNTARKERNFAEADEIRDRLKADGITIVDQKDGSSRWIRA
ncbi:MAG: cysteine--tRNA ligase [Cyanobacteria bacterium J06597_1]